MQKKIFVIGGAVLVVAIAAAMLRGGGGEDDAAGGAQQATGVTVTTVAQAQIELAEDLPGRTSAFKVAEIRPQVSGIITERAFTEGDKVAEGQQLYQIDAATYKAAYESAKAELQRAEAGAKSIKSRAKRYGELVEINAVSKQEYDDIKAMLAEAQADISVAKAKVQQARINVDYTKVYSPIAGRIGKSAVTEGALVTMNQAAVLTKVTQLDPIYVDMTQSSSALFALRSQMDEVEEVPVVLTLENGETYEHQGVLQFSDITVDETTGSVQLRALFPNPERLLLPGLFVHAQVMLGKQDVLLVPQKSTQRDSKGTLQVWVVGEDNTVNPRPITTVRAYEDQWVVASGVEQGETVVTEGFQKIRPGATVNATPQDKGEATAALPDQAAKEQ